MYSIKSHSMYSQTVHACNGPNDRGFYHSACGKMAWSPENFKRWRMNTLKSVDCSLCINTKEYQNHRIFLNKREQERESLNTLTNIIADQGLGQLIQSVVESLIDVTLEHLADNVDYTLSGNYLPTLIDSQPTSTGKAKVISDQVTSQLILLNNKLVVKKTLTAAQIIPGIVKALSLESMLAKVISRHRDEKSTEVSILEEELSELKKDLAETEEANEELIDENDEYRTQLRKVQDVLNHDK